MSVQASATQKIWMLHFIEFSVKQTITVLSSEDHLRTQYQIYHQHEISYRKASPSCQSNNKTEILFKFIKRLPVSQGIRSVN